MNNNLKIQAGGMYQKWMGLIDLVKDDIAQKLNDVAVKDGWRELQPNEAIEMGFEELVNWSKQETDVLVLVGDTYLVCLPKDGGANA